ncbi:uncharacterized protein GIQ15_00984 [Arthroderma uncinatum]|uniref:uncharacterized protein n=1 Tax=Arthroderma uncinatum TaxID=74035 RepID=UPI00144A7F23|nr:uncharacterized protein GIQ15_00984 [Arthroderma uncinatum]KAF3491467.1 hypothetical protein GIQ15_00984 [Arthroderma uncinatum]
MIVSTKLIMAVLAYDAALAVAAAPNAFNAGVANVDVNNIVERDVAMTVTVTMTDCGPASTPSTPAVPASSVTSVSASVPEAPTTTPAGSTEVPPSTEVPTHGSTTEVPTSAMSTPMVSESSSSIKTHTSATRETTHVSSGTATQTVAKPTPSAMASRHVGYHAALAGILGAAIFAAL